MKVATRKLLEEQIAVVVVLESGKKDDAMWHVPQSITSTFGLKFSCSTWDEKKKIIIVYQKPIIIISMFVIKNIYL